MLNKFGPSGHGEAQVQYLDGDFRVISPGTYVRCAVTDVAHTARRTEILERRSAGGLRRAGRGAAAAFSRRAEGTTLVAALKPALARLEQPVEHEFPQPCRVRRTQASPRTARCRAPSRERLRRRAAAPDPFPSSPWSTHRASPRRSARRSRFSRTDGDPGKRACAITSIPLPRSVLKNRAGSPIPAKARTRRPARRATVAGSGVRCARSTGRPCAAIAAATASAALPSPTTIKASVRASCWRSGARRGPAGNTPPLPMPRSPSITISEHPWRWRDSGTHRPSGSRWRPATAPGPRRRPDRAPPPPAAAAPASAARRRHRPQHGAPDRP